MTVPTINSWQGVQAEVQRRIHARIWPPGALIPSEKELAEEFGCARATVNRALRGLAESGVLDRRRKAGTHVAMHPVARATLSIPLIRDEISDRGAAPGYRLVAQRDATPPPANPALPSRHSRPSILPRTPMPIST